MAAGEQVTMIVNPISGRGGGARLAAVLSRRLQERGWSPQVRCTRGPGDAARWADESCRLGRRALVVVGGDGTVHDVMSGLSDPPAPILVAPTGTENLLAKYLGLRPDAEQLCQILEQQVVARLDIPQMNGRRFLIVAGIGFDAAVVRGVAAARRGHITYEDYFWPTWRTFWSFRQPEVRVEIDGQERFRGRGLVFVGNIRRYALGLQLLQRADPLDGLLDVCVFECTWQVPLLRHSINALLRRHLGSDGVFYAQAQKVRVSTDRPVDIELDGEWVGRTPAEFGMSGQRVPVLVSRERGRELGIA